MTTFSKNASTRLGAHWLAMFMLVSLFGACTRDTAEPQPAATDLSQLPLTEMALQNPERFVDILKKFSAQTKAIRENAAADQPDFSDTPAEDATALLEGTAHYDFRVRKNALSGFDKKDLTLTVDQVSSGALSGTGLQNAYNQLYAAIQKELSGQPGRILFLTDVMVKENRDGYTELAVTILTAINGQETPIPLFLCGVQPDDYWRPGGNMGKCDGCQTPKDAADREMEIMNPSICWPVCNGETITIWLAAVGGPFGYNDSPLGNLLWPMYGIFNIPTCLPPAEMQTNMDILYDIKNIYQPTNPLYKFACVWIRTTEFFNSDLEFTYHDGIMFYAPQYCLPGNGDQP